MKLLPLPNFYHFILFSIFILIIIFIILAFIFFRKREKRELKKISIKSKEDLYEISIRLQQLRLNEEIESLLEKLEKYKYSKSPKPLPKELKEEILKIWDKNLKNRV